MACYDEIHGILPRAFAIKRIEFRERKNKKRKLCSSMVFINTSNVAFSLGWPIIGTDIRGASVGHGLPHSWPNKLWTLELVVWKPTI